MGLFSKIGNIFKKVVRKIGGTIKKVTKPIRKALRAVMKPFGKVFGKLGWVGTIALGLMFPGFGNLMGSWMQGLTNFVMKPFQMLGNTIAPRMTNFLSNVVSGIKTGGKRIFSSITETFKHGINKMGQAFGYADPGKLSLVQGEGLVSGASISGAPVGTLTDSLTKGFTDLRDRVFGKPADAGITELGDWRGDTLPKLETTITKPGAGGLTLDPMDRYTDIIADPTDAPFGDTEFFGGKDPLGSGAYHDIRESVMPVSKEVSLLDPIQPLKVTADYRRPPELAGLTESAWEEYKKTDAWTDYLKEGRAANMGTQRGPFEKGLDWFGEKLADAKESPVGRGFQVASTGLDAYNTYLAEGPEAPWQNTMAPYANSMLTDVQQPGLEGLLFTDQATSTGMSPNQLAEGYLTGFGQVMPGGQYDPYSYAQQQPGYGYMFNDYLADYYG